jgi:hypothetical protein
MKIIAVGIIVAAFAYLPVFTLQTLVMPELTQLQQSYAHADQTVQALFPQQ